MHQPNRTITRREAMALAAPCAVALVVHPALLGAQDKPAVVDKLPDPRLAVPSTEPISIWEAAIRSVVGDAKVVVDERIVMDLPEIAENGNVVPMNVTVPSPMSETDFVRALRIYSTGNLIPLIATFHFSPDSGKATVSGRIRLAQSQDVIALAELADGSFLRRGKTVKVTIGGCGG
jgi:sulfur-oxidizing protein SoxY